MHRSLLDAWYQHANHTEQSCRFHLKVHLAFFCSALLGCILRFTSRKCFSCCFATCRSNWRCMYQPFLLSQGSIYCALTDDTTSACRSFRLSHISDWHVTKYICVLLLTISCAFSLAASIKACWAAAWFLWTPCLRCCTCTALACIALAADCWQRWASSYSPFCIRRRSFFSFSHCL